MSKASRALALAFLASLAANAVLLGRMASRTPEIRPTPESARPAFPAPPVNGVSSDSAAAELAALRREVAALANRLRETEAPGGGSNRPEGPAPRPGSSDWIAGILEEQERMDRFWADVGRISRATEGEPFRKALMGYTANFLGLPEPNRSAFIEAAEQAVAAVGRASDEYREATQNLPWNKSGTEAFELQQKAASDKYEATAKEARDRLLSTVPGTSAIQRRFAGDVGVWLDQMRGDGKVKKFGSSIPLARGRG